MVSNEGFKSIRHVLNSFEDVNLLAGFKSIPLALLEINEANSIARVVLPTPPFGEFTTINLFLKLIKFVLFFLLPKIGFGASFMFLICSFELKVSGWSLL